MLCARVRHTTPFHRRRGHIGLFDRTNRQPSTGHQAPATIGLTFLVDWRAGRPFGTGSSRAVKNANDAVLSVSAADLNRCAESAFFTALFRELEVRSDLQEIEG